MPYSDAARFALRGDALGRDEYKFLRDREWIPDPAAQEHVWNCYGTLNSVVEVKA